MRGWTVALLAASACGPNQPHTSPGFTSSPAPVARAEPFEETTFGITIRDNYRWMETNDREVRNWLKGQGAATTSWLAKVPEHAAMRARVAELLRGRTRVSGLQKRGQRIFYLRSSSKSQHPVLYVRDGFEGAERALLDPATTSKRGAIHGYAASPDGSIVAYNWSSQGSEIGSIRLIDVRTGAHMDDTLAPIWGEFPAIWLPDGRSFLYTQMAPKDSTQGDPLLNMRLRLHRLADVPASDLLVLEGNRNASMRLEPQEFPVAIVSKGSRWIIGAAIGAHPDARLSVAKLDELTGDSVRWSKVSDYRDRVRDFALRGSDIFLVIGEHNRKVVRLHLPNTDLASAETVVAEESGAVIESIAAAKNGIYVRRLEDGAVKLYWKPDRGRLVGVIPPFDGTVGNVEATTDNDGIIFSASGWTRPGTYYRWSPTSGLRSTPLVDSSSADFSRITSSRVLADSSDGEKVPITLVQRRDLVRDGRRPVLLSAYGAYGMTYLPSFAPETLAWLERGGIIAFAHVRGGGMKGRAWHIAGQGKNKLVGVKDLLACADRLVAEGYTTHGRIGARGASMGGLVVGGALVESPERFGAVVLSVAFVNPTRVLATQNGANQLRELGGSPETEHGFRILHSMDPYLKIRPSVRYPPTLLAVGLEDNRVEPWQSAKFAARLGAASPDTLVFVRTALDGHGVGTTRDEYAAKIADIYTFLIATLR